jgi:hypothetical protein
MHSIACILDEPDIRGAALPLTVEQYHRLSAEGIVPERTLKSEKSGTGAVVFGTKEETEGVRPVATSFELVESVQGIRTS